jgi:hypothetical protein
MVIIKRLLQYVTTSCYKIDALLHGVNQNVVSQCFMKEFIIFRFIFYRN